MGDHNPGTCRAQFAVVTIKALKALVGRLIVGWENGPGRGLKICFVSPLIHLLKANSVDPDQTPCTAASDTVCQTQQKILDNPLTQQADLTAIRTMRLFSVNNCYLAFIQIISDGHVDIKKRNAAVLNNFVSTDKQSTKKKKKGTQQILLKSQINRTQRTVILRTCNNTNDKKEHASI